MKTRLKRNERPARLLIVDPVVHSRDSLATFLGLQEHLEVLGVASGAAKAVQLAQQYQPDVVIMDIHLPDMDGFTATQRLLALKAPPAVVLLTVHHRAQDLLRAQEAGAVATVEKSAGVDAILEVLGTLSNIQSKES